MAQEPVADAEVAPLLWPTGVCNGLLADTTRDLAGRMAACRAATGRAGVSLEAVEEGLALFRRRVVNEASLSAAVASRHLDWIGLQWHELRFPSHEAAAEALLCLRDDGLEIDEVAQLAGIASSEVASLLGEVESGSRDALLGAQPGELVGPVPAAGGYVVARLDCKVLPSLDQPSVRGRAEALVLSGAIHREFDEWVRWHDWV
ncbi:MAG: peptidylprolyl isomerase [Actinomycetota bacterium]|nr:peptidylprolyl isomerase [Actinomycetota bacterium]